MTRGPFSNASADDFRNHKIPVFLTGGIGQHAITLEMFALLIVAKGIGQKDRMRCGADPFSFKLIEFINISQYFINLPGELLNGFIIQIQACQVRNVQNFFFGYFHGLRCPLSFLTSLPEWVSSRLFLTYPSHPPPRLCFCTLRF